VKRIYITSIGIVSSIGNNVEETVVSLLEEKRGQGTTEFVDSDLARSFPLCEVKLSNDELANRAGVSKDTFITRCSLLAAVAAKEAADGAKIRKDDGISTGLICGTTVGGMDRSELFYREFSKDNSTGDINDVKCHDCGDTAAKVAKMLGTEDYITTLSTACSSSANSFISGARLLRAGDVERMVVGGSDALTFFTANGFNSLRILDKELCKPFDAERKGLNLGEAAAFAVLETEETLKKTGNKPICELKGYHNCAEAYHQTASSPEGDGAYSAMTGALKKAGLKIEDVSYINAHGTGTGNNDMSESIAIKRVFGDNVPNTSSTKGLTGHTLGASGAVEAVISILAIRDGFIPASAGFDNPIPESDLMPAKEIIKDFKIIAVMSNSFGFGGNNTSLIFSR
jgi:3-oxoacyl-[acyl-carrier-protein] synthase-1